MFDFTLGLSYWLNDLLTHNVCVPKIKRMILSEDDAMIFNQLMLSVDVRVILICLYLISSSSSVEFPPGYVAIGAGKAPQHFSCFLRPW
jgi:hypothetical protein